MSRPALNVPNLLTGLRLVAAPALALLVLSGRFGAAFVVFALAGLSDAADGFLAKRFGWTTDIGRILDPVADKLLMLGSFLALTAVGAVPVWLAGLVIGRDVVIVFGAVLAWALDLPLRVAPLPLGKISTGLQITYVAATLLLALLGIEFDPLAIAMALIVGAFTLASGLNYAALWLKALARASRTA